ncbi:MFS general substrate transporter [Cylindrobasidium torrendii FP15055 ss-10]|uniref:MFS general substrate transporter n=1 Tax=Cylindrobasidium torrendii FP15055 ss-10 TaxID=1314674 RepID=A0A0D7AZU3_9AGAR|nr:MFS general substrate transporter [Cylindrobasidium torrendii FP15055 ss-10]
MAAKRSFDEDLDKAQAVDIDVKQAASDGVELYRPEVDTSGIDERKLLRKVDLWVVPWLSLLYLLNFLDRGTVGNAKLYGLEDNIGITDNQYLIALTVFFFPYALFEPASNVLLRKLRPSIWLSLMIFFWGVVTTLHGVVKNYAGLICVRVFLGLTEAGMYPGIVFYISSWYKRTELGTRVAFFFSSATVAGAFSGLLAAGIHNMDGIGGLEGWRWIFILEGLFTVLVGVASFWMVQDFPETAKFLSDTERVFIIRRLQDDMKLSAAGEKYKTKYIWQSLKDWKTWVAMGIYMGFDGPLFAFSLFLPTILNQLGYTSTTANLLSVPVYAWGCLVTCVIGFLGDRIGHRAYINLVLFGTGLIGYIILVASKTPALSYFAVFLASSAIYPTIRDAWVAGNCEGVYKRGVTLAMAIGFGNINGAVTSNIYRSKDKPWYPMGHGIVLAYIAIGWICSLLFFILLKRENAKRDNGERDEVIEGVDNKNADPKNGTYATVLEARIDKGDEWSGFRYTL